MEGEFDPTDPMNGAGLLYELRAPSDDFCADGYLKKPDCFDAQDPYERCYIKGNKELDAPLQTRFFLYLQDPETGCIWSIWTRTQILFQGQPSKIVNADVDSDGRAEIIVGGYLTSALPEAFATRPLPLLDSSA